MQPGCRWPRVRGQEEPLVGHRDAQLVAGSVDDGADTTASDDEAVLPRLGGLRAAEDQIRVGFHERFEVTAIPGA